MSTGIHAPTGTASQPVIGAARAARIDSAADASTDTAGDTTPDGAIDYQQVVYPYRRSVDQDGPFPARHPVVVVGAGPVGLTAAIDLALQGVPVVLLNNDGRLSVGSRALCFAKRTLEIFDRLGCGQRIVDKGVSWGVGRVFFRDEQVYQFDLLAEAGHQRPAFVNLQQYYVEGFLVERALGLPLIDLRWHHGVVGVEQREDHVELRVETPEGPYTLHAAHVVACDGSRSTVRRAIGQESHGRTFKDRFLIADVRMNAPFPAERWFWFDPPFHPGQSVLLHRQPDGVWRIDFQLGWDADPELEKRPERILPRVRTLMHQASIAAGGDGVVPDIELVWASVYTFSCMRMDSFRHGRVLFAGDAAHGVSPFGARGANSGVQDAENLAWKLAAVVQGRAPQALLDSYAREREFAADENLRHSSRSTDFITPKSEISRVFRDATLTLAKDFAFARRLVNSGRLSVPAVLTASSLNADDQGNVGDVRPGQEVPHADGAASPRHANDAAAFDGAMRPGAPAVDAPIRRDGHEGWLLRLTRPGRFTAIVFEDDEAGAGTAAAALSAVAQGFEGLEDPVVITIAEAADVDGLIRARYDGRPGTVVLLRPDQHVCARWRDPTPASICAAVRRALAHA
ncbi:FAD-dependent oxidoreductase [Roseateles aquatilis]|uniref:FAD-dependent oxidoreductase n=2 Tax=Roseateles aquatilis TaxID=431061 RepID=A0A246JLB3_9BURK|nr:FAD-dependent oxidoreductase [Roseateles aquatilis]